MWMFTRQIDVSSVLSIDRDLQCYFSGSTTSYEYDVAQQCYEGSARSNGTTISKRQLVLHATKKVCEWTSIDGGNCVDDDDKVDC